LEIRLWESFVRFTNETDSDTKSPITLSGVLQLGKEHTGDTEAGGDEIGNGNGLKGRLMSLAKKELPSRVGSKYAAVVLNTCLTCLDPGNDRFGDEKDMQDEDRILIGVRFIEKVPFKLSDISL